MQRKGWWGVPDTRAPGAETPYAVTPCICEFWNTVSNAGFFLVAYVSLRGIVSMRVFDYCVQNGVLGTCLFLVSGAFGWNILHCAVASTVCHATGRESMRLWDLAAVALAVVRVVLIGGFASYPIRWIALALAVLAVDEWKRCTSDYYKKHGRKWYNILAAENRIGRWLSKRRLLMDANLHPLWHITAAWAAYRLVVD